jgi:hypothetical protein
VRTIGIMIVSMALSFGVAMWQEQRPWHSFLLSCGSELGYDPQCGDSQECLLSNFCTGYYGARLTFCCDDWLDEQGVPWCRDFEGRWECCTNSWKKECRAYDPVEGWCNEQTGICYGG